MGNFISTDDSFLSALKSLSNSKTKAETVIPGGQLNLNNVLDNKILNSTALDIIGGAGQYKLPQRLMGAGIGAYALRDENNTPSVIGAGSGYAGSAGIEHLIKSLRRSELDKGFNNLAQTGALVDVRDSNVAEALKRVSEEIKSNNLRNALHKDTALEVLLKSPMGGNYTDRLGDSKYNSSQAFYTGDLLDDEIISRLNKTLPGEAKKIPNIPGFSSKEYANLIKSRLAGLQADKANLNSIGINAGSLRNTGYGMSVKYHELLEMLEAVNKNNKPMTGGSFGMLGRNDLGISELNAQHNSAAVPLRESNLNAKILSNSGKALSDKLRHGTGEAQLIKALLGSDLDNIIIPDHKINEKANALVDIINKYKSNEQPSKQLLDKVRVNKLTSLLGSAGKNISNLEGSFGRLLKNLIKR